MWGHFVAFLRRHKRSEETALSAVALDLLWLGLRLAGVFGAGFALAAVVTTSSPTYHPQFSLSTKGAAFLTRYEGVRYAPYNDAVGYCTTGVGHLIAYHPCTAAEIRQWTLTPAQATALLMHDAGSSEAAVRADVTHTITQYQFDALVSFTFNVGAGGLAESQALRDVNDGTFSMVPLDLNHWDTAGGQFLMGLLHRRQAEGFLFTYGNYGAGIGKYVPPTPPNPLTIKTGYWAWLAWHLGEGPWKGHGAKAVKLRPDVPVRVRRSWWAQEKRFVQARASNQRGSK